MSLPYRFPLFILVAALCVTGCGKPGATASKDNPKTPAPAEEKTATEQEPADAPANTDAPTTKPEKSEPQDPVEQEPPKEQEPVKLSPEEKTLLETNPPKAADNTKDKLEDPPGFVRLHPTHPVWIDKENKRVAMKGFVCLREGQLEMLVTLAGTKEHEAVVAVNCKAMIVHAALLSLGAEAIHPVRFRPQYTPAKGTEIDVHFEWTAPDGKKHLVKAQEWVRTTRTQQEMDYPFVFGGSGFYREEIETKEGGPKKVVEHYLAEEGDFICVSNFPTAMLDLPVESSQSADGLLFEAFTERMPPAKTPVMVYLTPKLNAAGKAPEKKTEKAASD